MERKGLVVQLQYKNFEICIYFSLNMPKENREKTQKNLFVILSV